MTVTIDPQNLNAVLSTALHTFITASRQTGKTYRMIQNLKKGDIVVTINQKNARYLQSKIAPELKVKVIVVDNRLDAVPINYGGNVHFDHLWVEQYYQKRIEDAASHLITMANYLSPRASAEMSGKVDYA